MKSEFFPKSRAKRTSPGRKFRGAVTPERLKLAKDPRFLLDRGLNPRGDTGVVIMNRAHKYLLVSLLDALLEVCDMH